MKADGGGMQAVLAASARTRMRWYAELNAWRTPNDFPVRLRNYGGAHDVQFRDPEWRAAFDGVSESLTEAERSLGWWVFSSLKETPEAWRAWWVGNTKRNASEADAAIAAYLVNQESAK